MSDYPIPQHPAPNYSQLLSNKNVVVSGGGAGIGGSISRVFAGASGQVLLVDIEADYANSAVKDIKEAGGQAHALVGDIQDKAVVSELQAKVDELFGGRVDVLVNNVGHYVPYKLFANSEEEDWETQFQICFIHVLRCTRAFLPAMIERRSGSIINVSSVEGMRGIPGNAVYSALKAGLINFTRSLAVEVGRYGVRVNGLAPDATHTPQTPMYQWHADAKMTGCWVPLGRFAHPDEQADAALFLASDQGRFVTGHTLVTDGGTLAASGWYRTDPEQDNWSNTPYFQSVDNDILPE